MTLVLAGLYSLLGFCLGYLSDVFVAETLYVVLGITLQFGVLQYWFITIPPLNTFLIWNHLAFLAHAIVGQALRDWGTGHGPILHWKRSIKVNLLIMASGLAFILPVVGYLRLSLPWNIVVLFVGFIVIKVGSYVVWRGLVEQNVNMNDVQIQLNKDMDYMNPYVVYTAGDVFISVTNSTIGGTIIILGQFFQYLTILGPFAELWTQLIVGGILSIVTAGIIFFYRRNDGNMMWGQGPSYVNGKKSYKV